jgi:hypothetical protein
VQHILGDSKGRHAEHLCEEREFSSIRLAILRVMYLQTFFIKGFHKLYPPLWSSGRVLGYRSRGHGFDSRRYQILWEVVCLERGPLSLVSTIQEQLCWSRDTLYPQKLAITSLASGGRSVGIVRLRAKATELVCLFVCLWYSSANIRVIKTTDSSGMRWAKILRAYERQKVHTWFLWKRQNKSDN